MLENKGHLHLRHGLDDAIMRLHGAMSDKYLAIVSFYFPYLLYPRCDKGRSASTRRNTDA